MGIEINTIITLSNNDKYKVINETMYSGKKYFLMVEIVGNQEVVFEEEIEGLDTYVKKVNDSELFKELIEILKK